MKTRSLRIRIALARVRRATPRHYFTDPDAQQIRAAIEEQFQPETPDEIALVHHLQEVARQMLRHAKLASMLEESAAALHMSRYSRHADHPKLQRAMARASAWSANHATLGRLGERYFSLGAKAAQLQSQLEHLAATSAAPAEWTKQSQPGG